MIRKFQSGEESVCEDILRGLPEWFGKEKAILGYIAALSRLETWVVERSGRVVGFLAIERFGALAAEIDIVAVERKHHGEGNGRRLVEHVFGELRRESIEFVQVKTIGSSHPSEAYARTRGFYRKVGFVPLEETTLWGPENPCLIMVRHLACERTKANDS